MYYSQTKMVYKKLARRGLSEKSKTLSLECNLYLI